MSIELMSKAFKAKVNNPLRKLVLIKLADNANDRGVCHPSYQHIADQCEISRRSVIEHIKALQKMGVLSIKHRFNDGENTSNSFHIFEKKLNELCSAGDSLGSERAALGSESPALGSERAAPPLVKELHPEPSLSNHHLTIIESVRDNAREKSPLAKNQKLNATTPSLAEKPESVSDDLWVEWLSVRKSKKQPMPTKRALQAITDEAIKAGLSIEQAITECCDRGWASFKATWYENSQASIGRTNRTNTFDQSGNLEQATFQKNQQQQTSKMAQGLAALQAMKSTNKGQSK